MTHRSHEQGEFSQVKDQPPRLPSFALSHLANGMVAATMDYCSWAATLSMGCTGTVNYGPVAFLGQEARDEGRRRGKRSDVKVPKSTLSSLSGSVRGQGDAGSVPPGAGRSARAPSDAHKPCFAVVLTAPTRKMVEELHMPV